MEKLKRILLIVVFCVVITLPGFLLMLGFEAKPDKYENKKTAERPQFEIRKHTLRDIYKSIKHFKNDFEQYIDNRLFVREFFLNIHKQIKIRLFHTHSHPLQVITVTDGWMFGVDIDGVMNHTIGQEHLSRLELDNIESNLKSVRNFLSEKNIKYYFLIAPNKHSVYYSKMGFEKIAPFRIKHQLLNILEKNDIPYIDPVEKLKFESKNTQVFFKTDTHWNNYGAYIAFQMLIEKINSDFNLPIDSYVILNQDNLNRYRSFCDLSRMNRSLKKESYTNNITVSNTGTLLSSKLKVPLMFNRKKEDYEIRFHNANKKYKVVVFRDSFSDALRLYFAANFQEVVFIWYKKFSREIILKEKPDIVITEVVERFIPQLIDYDQLNHEKTVRAEVQ